MRIISKGTLDLFRGRAQCEFCGERLRRASEAAHIFSRGAGRLDITVNLCALGGPWCCGCHHKSHQGGEPTREQLLELVGRREGVTPASIELAVYALRRAPKEADCEAVLAEWLVRV